MQRHHVHRIVWYATLNSLILFFLYGLTVTVAGTGAVVFVLTLAHLGIVPMLTHHYLRKHDGDRMKGAWTIGVAFATIGLALDGVAYGYYLGQGNAFFTQWTTILYFALRVFLAPITAKWLEPHLAPE